MPSYHDYDTGQAAAQLVCPECGETAVHQSPTAWTPAWGPAPAYAHTDGQPLCPVIGPDGYQAAEPVMAPDHLTTETSAGAAPAEALACADCGHPADVEALRLGPGDELLSDVPACAEHADPYLATATDVLWTDTTAAAAELPVLTDTGDELTDDLGL
jgi:hypothetical protein